LCYNPDNIIRYIENKLKGETTYPTINPYYEGFKGTIVKVAHDKFMFKGCYKLIGTDKIEITELPVGTWTEKYKIFLESLICDSSKKDNNKKCIIRSYIDMCTDVEVHFTINLTSGTVNRLLPKSTEYGCNALEKAFRLYTTRKTSNMHLFDENQRLKKYKKVEEIIEHYYPIRLMLYQKRKDYLIMQLKQIVKILSNKARFIKEQCDDNLDLRKKKRNIVIQLLKSMNFDKINDDETFKYLRTMPIDSVEEENFSKLMKERDEKQTELDIIKSKTIESMWIAELAVLKTNYKRYKRERNDRQCGTSSKKIKIKRKRHQVKKKR
jgi:DNA topoisomerase-2